VRKRIVVVDKMQHGYRYALTDPTGRNFDHEFRPGKYMTDCIEEFPRLVQLRRARQKVP
jgi:hypothetical protein